MEERKESRGIFIHKLLAMQAPYAVQVELPDIRVGRGAPASHSRGQEAETE